MGTQTPWTADAVVDEIKRQVRDMRAAGAAPCGVELGDAAFELLVQRWQGATRRDHLVVNTLEDRRLRVWFPGAGPEHFSGDVMSLPVRRVGPGATVRVVS